MRSTPRSCPPHSMDWSNSHIGWIFAWRSGRNTAIRTGVESFDPPSSARSATSPRFGFTEEEPMQIGRAHLTARERRHRIAHGLCLYCGEAGHMITVCPHKRQSSSGERPCTVGVTAALCPRWPTTLPAVLNLRGSPTRWQRSLTRERRGISWTLS